MSAGSSAFSTDDTIVAIATAPGRGALGVVRVSGSDALPIAQRLLTREQPLLPRHATFTRVRSDESSAGDEVVVTYFNRPQSYTGEDVVEISAHGSPIVLAQILRRACAAGARLARPGEFTLRAFLNGKRDLVQAEAVGDLIASVTPLQARVAFDQLQGTLTARIAATDRVLFDLIARLEASLDFPDEGYHFVDAKSGLAELERVVGDVEHLLRDSRRGRMIREGAQVVIAGRTNVGKSSIFNKLAGVDRAIVTEVAGTTRDLVTETIDLCGIPVSLVDTAGVRVATDPVEQEGIRRATAAQSVAEVLVLVLDRSEPLQPEDLQMLADTRDRVRVAVANKSDLPAAFESVEGVNVLLPVSAQTGDGIDALRRAIVSASTSAGFETRPPNVGERLERDTVAISNLRHIELMEDALRHLRRAMAALHAQTPEEFVLMDLQEARQRFDEVVGVRTSDAVIAHIFERFCIGK